MFHSNLLNASPRHLNGHPTQVGNPNLSAEEKFQLTFPSLYIYAKRHHIDIDYQTTFDSIVGELKPLVEAIISGNIGQDFYQHPLLNFETINKYRFNNISSELYECELKVYTENELSFLVMLAVKHKRQTVLDHFYSLAVQDNSEKKHGSRWLLFWAIITHQQPEVIEQLLDKNTLILSVHIAAAAFSNNVNFLKFRTANLQLKYKNFLEALVILGYPESLEFFLMLGENIFDLYIIDYDLEFVRATLAAIEKSTLECLNLLLRAGALVNIGYLGIPLIHTAVQAYDPIILKRLMKVKNFRLAVINKHKENTLDVAKNSPEATRELLLPFYKEELSNLKDHLEQQIDNVKNQQSASQYGTVGLMFFSLANSFSNSTSNPHSSYVKPYIDTIQPNDFIRPNLDLNAAKELHKLLSSKNKDELIADEDLQIVIRQVQKIQTDYFISNKTEMGRICENLLKTLNNLSTPGIVRESNLRSSMRLQ